jgi:hypothetical protein
MRLFAAVLLALACSSCVLGGKHAVNLLGGYRTHSGDFDGAEDTPTLGVEGMIGLTTDGVSLEGGYSYAERDSSGAELEVQELYLGLRKTWGTSGLIQPYIGMGANWMDASAQDPFDIDFSGDGLGAYARVGIGFQFAIFQTGVDLRGSWSSASAGGEDLSYLQGALFIGLSF